MIGYFVIRLILYSCVTFGCELSVSVMPYFSSLFELFLSLITILFVYSPPLKILFYLDFSVTSDFKLQDFVVSYFLMPLPPGSSHLKMLLISLIRRFAPNNAGRLCSMNLIIITDDQYLMSLIHACFDFLSIFLA